LSLISDEVHGFESNVNSSAKDILGADARPMTAVGASDSGAEVSESILQRATVGRCGRVHV